MENRHRHLGHLGPVDGRWWRRSPAVHLEQAADTGARRVNDLVIVKIAQGQAQRPLVTGQRQAFGFFGLDVLLVYFAFRANYRSARAYEEVIVTASELTVRKVNHRGGVREWTLNPLWVRLERIVHEEFGIERLFLVSHGRRLAIARFLGPAEKASFARALANALGEAKRGPTRTTIA